MTADQMIEGLRKDLSGDGSLLARMIYLAPTECSYLYELFGLRDKVKKMYEDYDKLKVGDKKAEEKKTTNSKKE